MRSIGLRVDRNVRMDAFQLYSGYIDLVQPIEIDHEMIELEDKISEL